MTNHKHNYKLLSYSGREVSYRCSCGNEYSRSTTKQEAKDISASILRSISPPREHNVHFVWHRVQRAIDRLGNSANNSNLHSIFKRFSRQYPKDVVICRCDDSMHMGSQLVLIHHQCKYGFMGTSVFILTQAERTPMKFFLYPGHSQQLIKELSKTKGTIKRTKASYKQYEANIPIHPTLGFKLK